MTLAKIRQVVCLGIGAAVVLATNAAGASVKPEVEVRLEKPPFLDCIAFSSDGSRLFFVQDSKRIVSVAVVGADKGLTETIDLTDVLSSPVYSLSTALDNNVILIGGDAFACLYSIKEKKLVTQWKWKGKAGSYVAKLALSPDGKLLYVCRLNDSQVRIWNVGDGREVDGVSIDGVIQDLSATQDRSRFLLSMNQSATVHKAKFASYDPVRRIVSKLPAEGFSDRGRQQITTNAKRPAEFLVVGNQIAALYDEAVKEPRHDWRARNDLSGFVKGGFCVEGTVVVLVQTTGDGVSLRGVIDTYWVKTGGLIRSFECADSQILGAAICPDGKCVAVATATSIRVWNIESIAGK